MKREFLPGSKIDGDEFEKLQVEIFHAENPENLSDEERFWQLFANQRPAEEVMRTILECESEEYYLLYTHPIDDKYNYLHVANKAAALSFIDEFFNDELSIGADVIITDKKYSILYYGNHDGMLMQG